MIRRILATTALSGALFAAAAASAQDSQDPIRLTLNDWTGQLLTTHLMGEVLEKAGLNVEYVQADYLAQFAGLKTGDLHVAMEIWETTGREAMDEATATGQVVNLGETGMQAIEEWWSARRPLARPARSRGLAVACRLGGGAPRLQHLPGLCLQPR
jgi:glycine betaine/proline transport system substrate-binding protein